MQAARNASKFETRRFNFFKMLARNTERTTLKEAIAIYHDNELGV
jgi:hypothetical protein